MFQPQLSQILSKFLTSHIIYWPQGATSTSSYYPPKQHNMSNAKETTQQRAHVVALDGSEDADKAFVWALRNLVNAHSPNALG